MEIIGDGGEVVQPAEKISNIHFNRNGLGRMGTKITHKKVIP
jgi:hypothetical protein